MLITSLRGRDMKGITIIFLLALSGFLFLSCNETDSIVIGNPGGTFQGNIVLYDSLGAVWTSGTIKITQTNSTDLNGSWSFQNGESGNLVGSIDNMKLQINLNPGFADNNTFLNGDFEGNTIKGQWYHDSFIGVDNWGTFLATAF
jgi:hypothetical protein